MMRIPKSTGIVLRIVVVIACCYGIWDSLKFARADWYFRKNNDESIRTAIRMVPDGWAYYMRLAQLDRGDARSLLVTSLQLNPYDAQADIELGLQYEAEGDYARAERQLLEAYDVDHTYLPRWTLANYYFRRDDLKEFWKWARSAAAMPADDIGALLELCWRASPDPQVIYSALVNDDPKMLRQFVKFLLDKGQSRFVAGVALRLVHSGDSISDRPLMFDAINRLVAVGDAASASAVWRTLMKTNWVNADRTVPNNARFEREPLPVSFDWSLREYNGMHSWPGASGLETEFSGSEPEECTVAEQVVALAPGKYSFDFSYRTSNIPAGTGVRWQVLDVRSGMVLGESEDISSEELKNSEFRFTVPVDAPLQRVRLLYRRSLGTTRISGTINTFSVQMRAFRDMR